MLTIITIITAVVLTSQSSFNKTLILQNTAYDIALTLRSAETFGLSSRGFGTTYNAGYGLHFSSGAKDSFILFADTVDATGGTSCAGELPNCKPGDYVYTSGSDVLVRTYTLGNGITVDDFCVYSSGGGPADCSISSLDIVFERPNPDAHVTADDDANEYDGGACITVTSPQGGFKHVTVAASGQINGNASSCQP